MMPNTKTIIKYQTPKLYKLGIVEDSFESREKQGLFYRDQANICLSCAKCYCDNLNTNISPTVCEIYKRSLKQ
jgi:hypothetical protein